MSFGRVSDLKLNEDKWSMYIARVQQYFKADDIKAEKETAILLTVRGKEAFQLITHLCSPHKPEDKTFQGLNETVKNHLDPKPSEIAERYKFRERKQQEGDSVAVFVAMLKNQARTCNFGGTLEYNLRNQLLFGLGNEAIRQRLFMEKCVLYSTAYEIAINMEKAD